MRKPMYKLSTFPSNRQQVGKADNSQNDVN